MSKPVSIEYTLVDGRGVRIDLRQVGHTDEWILDLLIHVHNRWEKRHQHAIDGEPEVTVG